MQTSILIIDDDVELSGLLKEYFEVEGLRVRQAFDGRTGLDEARKPGVDLIVLDVMMPEMDGMAVLKELRKESRIPVVMLTARGEDNDRITGLELGADDYLPKPCNPRELLARIRAVLRRSTVLTGKNEIVIDDLEMNIGARQLVRAGEEIDLTSTEFSILQALLQHQGEVVSKRDLYIFALNREPVQHDRSVDMHVSNLRRKLGPTPSGQARIETIRGIGYQYRAF